MPNCQEIDPLVTPFVDGELPESERRLVEDHLSACPPCHSRVAAERTVHALIRARKALLCTVEAPDALHHRCAGFARAGDESASAASGFANLQSTPQPNAQSAARNPQFAVWRARLAP